MMATAISTVYAIGDSGVKLGAGYADGNQNVSDYPGQLVADKNGNMIKISQENPLQLERSQYMLAASYEINDFYFAANYVNGQDKLKVGSGEIDRTGYEFAAAYTMDKTVFTTTYNKLRNEIEGGSKYDAADNIAVDATTTLSQISVDTCLTTSTCLMKRQITNPSTSLKQWQKTKLL